MIICTYVRHTHWSLYVCTSVTCGRRRRHLFHMTLDFQSRELLKLDMLRTSSFTLSVFRYPMLQQIIRFSSTNATAGSINAGHDKFTEREQALENQYFRKQSEELITSIVHLRFTDP
ncbi:unnamed protein product [Didymodactylos carnosus]|uniref:Uncharacterized protein n=1 Tax=Didymodactylos carnosus TaxID=1234261 RepID=A0A816B6G9_9BILA|nr:unnamed protein product [Didymodactylos carnosus]CAF4487186.1 unnamed protein product [Didymodactylos carnosus]